MSQLIALGFQNDADADAFISEVEGLEKAQLLGLGDMVKVTRKDDGKVKIKQMNHMTGIGALSGAFWGMLIGFIFFMPFVGMAVGAAAGAVAGHFTDIGMTTTSSRASARPSSPARRGSSCSSSSRRPIRSRTPCRSGPARSPSCARTCPPTPKRS